MIVLCCTRSSWFVQKAFICFRLIFNFMTAGLAFVLLSGAVVRFRSIPFALVCFRALLRWFALFALFALGQRCRSLIHRLHLLVLIWLRIFAFGIRCCVAVPYTFVSFSFAYVCLICLSAKAVAFVLRSVIVIGLRSLPFAFVC